MVCLLVIDGDGSPQVQKSAENQKKYFYIPEIDIFVSSSYPFLLPGKCGLHHASGCDVPETQGIFWLISFFSKLYLKSFVNLNIK